MTQHSRLKSIRAAILIASLAMAGTALAFGVRCSLDNYSAYFTGVTRVDSATGKLLKQYKCANNHVFWAVD